jgi:hypothetical protein
MEMEKEIIMMNKIITSIIGAIILAAGAIMGALLAITFVMGFLLTLFFDAWERS